MRRWPTDIDPELKEQLTQFGRNIRHARERAGFSQDTVPYERAAISNLERARRAPNLPVIVDVAYAVEVMPSDLFDGIGPPVRAEAPAHAYDPDTAPRAIFGANLRRERKRAGIAQERLGLLARVDRTAINLFEHGRREPNLRTILKLARTLEVSPGALLVGIAPR